MKILVMGSYDPVDIANGMGSIAQNSMRCMVELGHEVSGVFMVDDFTADGTARHSVYRQSRPEFLNRLPVVRFRRRKDAARDTLRALSRVFPSSPERRFQSEIRWRSGRSDLAVWFGTLWDPLSRAILAACECPVILHVNDSITLVRRQRSASLTGRIQTAVARYQESGAVRQLRAGRAAIVYVAETDRQAALTMAKPGHSTCVSCLPLAVNTDVFAPATEPKRASACPVLLFTGHMGYTPNVLAATNLVHNILPLLPQALEMRFVGRSPLPSVRELARHDRRVRVTGPVEDIVREYQLADIFVAAMPFSYGMKTKVLEAMSCGLPVVASPEACSGFGSAPPGILVGNSPAEVAELITRLLADPDLRQSLGSAGREHAVRHYGWTDRTRRLVSLFQTGAGL